MLIIFLSEKFNKQSRPQPLPSMCVPISGAYDVVTPPDLIGASRLNKHGRNFVNRRVSFAAPTVKEYLKVRSITKSKNRRSDLKEKLDEKEFYRLSKTKRRNKLVSKVALMDSIHFEECDGAAHDLPSVLSSNPLSFQKGVVKPEKSLDERSTLVPAKSQTSERRSVSPDTDRNLQTKNTRARDLSCDSGSQNIFTVLEEECDSSDSEVDDTGHNYWVRNGAALTDEVMGFDPEVASSLSGSHGEWTCTDDLDQVSVREYRPGVLTISIPDRMIGEIGCDCSGSEHCHVSPQDTTRISAVHRRFLARQSRRNAPRACGTQPPPRTTQQPQRVTRVSFKGFRCNTQSCRTTHFHIDDGVLRMVGGGIRVTGRPVDEVADDDDSEPVQTTLGESLRTTAHVSVVSNNEGSPSSAETRGDDNAQPEVVVAQPMPETRRGAAVTRALPTDTLYADYGHLERNSPPNMRSGPLTVCKDNDNKRYGVFAIYTITNDGVTSGTRNMCFFISLSSALASFNLNHTPQDLARLFPSHTCGEPFDAADRSNIEVLLSILEENDITIHFWASGVSDEVKVYHAEVMGVGRRHVHFTAFGSHFEFIRGFSLRALQGSRLDVTLIDSWNSNAPFDESTLVRRPCFLPGRDMYFLNTRHQMFRVNLHVPAQILPRDPVLSTVVSMMSANGGQPSVVENLMSTHPINVSSLVPMTRIVHTQSDTVDVATPRAVAALPTPSIVPISQESVVVSQLSPVQLPSSPAVVESPQIPSSQSTEEQVAQDDPAPTLPIPFTDTVSNGISSSAFNFIGPVDLVASPECEFFGCGRCDVCVAYRNANPPPRDVSTETPLCNASRAYQQTNFPDHSTQYVLLDGEVQVQAELDECWRPCEAAWVVPVPGKNYIVSFDVDGVVKAFDRVRVVDLLLSVKSVLKDRPGLLAAMYTTFYKFFYEAVDYTLPVSRSGIPSQRVVNMSQTVTPTLLTRILTLGWADNSVTNLPDSQLNLLEGSFFSHTRGLIFWDLAEVLSKSAQTIGSSATGEFWTWVIPRYKMQVSARNTEYFSLHKSLFFDIDGHGEHTFNAITINTIMYVISNEVRTAGMIRSSMPTVAAAERSARGAFTMSAISSITGTNRYGGESFMGIVRANDLMRRGVGVRSFRSPEINIITHHELRHPGVYYEGLTRMLPCTCEKSMDWVFNDKFKVVKGKQFLTPQHYIQFPEEIDVKIEEAMRYSHVYSTIYGYAFAHTGRIYGNNDINISKMVERHWKVRLPEEQEIHSLPKYGITLLNFDQQLMSNQAYFAIHNAEDFIRQTEESYGPFEYFTSIQEAAALLILVAHIKQRLRKDAFAKLNDSGDIGNIIFVNFLVWKLKTMELAKFMKPPRVIVDAQTENSLPSVHISNAWKEHSSDKPVVYFGCVSIVFSSSPSPSSLSEVFKMWDYYTYPVVIANYSDDSIIGLWNPILGVYDMFNTDIRGNDASHTGYSWSVFARLLRMSDEHYTFLFKMLFAKNYLYSRNKRSMVVFVAKYGYLPSGIGETSIANNTAMLMIAYQLGKLISNGYTVELSLVTLAAFKCGFLLSHEKFSLHDEFGKMQFLKNSPYRLPSGEVVALPNLGRMLRYSGRSKNDVTKKLCRPPPGIELFSWYQTLLTYGDFKRIYYEPLCVHLCPHFHLVSPSHHSLILHLRQDLSADVFTSEVCVVTRDVYYSRYFNYGLSHSMIEEFEHYVASSGLRKIVYSQLVDIVLQADYGLSPAVL